MSDAVIVAAGSFPARKSPAYGLLTETGHIVACDGALAPCHRRLGRWPDAVVGDLDSVDARVLKRVPETTEVVRIADQNTNDLEKAVAYCRKRGWRNVSAVGATGLREDHTIGNVFRGLALGIEILTDTGRFVPCLDFLEICMKAGTPLSVFATDPATEMRSEGLVWPLDGVRFANLYCATLNRAAGDCVRLWTNRPVYVYYPYGK